LASKLLEKLNAGLHPSTISKGVSPRIKERVGKDNEDLLKEAYAIFLILKKNLKNQKKSKLLQPTFYAAFLYWAAYKEGEYKKEVLEFFKQISEDPLGSEFSENHAYSNFLKWLNNDADTSSYRIYSLALALVKKCVIKEDVKRLRKTGHFSGLLELDSCPFFKRATKLQKDKDYGWNPTTKLKT